MVQEEDEAAPGALSDALTSHVVHGAFMGFRHLYTIVTIRMIKCTERVYVSLLFPCILSFL